MVVEYCFAYLDPALAGPNGSEDALELAGVDVVGNVPDEQAHEVGLES